MDENIKENLDLTEEKIESEVKGEEKKKSKKGIIIFLVILLLIGVGVGCFVLGQYFSKNSEGAKEEKPKDNPVTPGVVTLKDYVKDNELVKVDSLTGVAKLYTVDINAGNDIVVYSGYDGYYVVNKSGTYYLKRNQKEVSKIDNFKMKVYKDSSDSNSKYISVFCSPDYCEFAKAADENYAYLSSYGDETVVSVILNVNTGVNKIFDNSEVSKVEGIDETIFIHESTVNNTISIVSLNDFSLKNAKGVYIAGDAARLAQGDGIYSKSTKYVVVKNSNSYENVKYGVYDYQMNKKIDFSYDDLNTVSDDLFIAKKGNKYGIIDATNKTIIEFNYDGIEAIDNYYVAIKDGKLGVLDKEGKEVVPFNYDVPKDMEFTLRLCCADENSFSVSKKVDQIIISYYDTTRVEKDSRYGYYVSYIILNKDGTYSRVEYLDKAYNYSDEFYYYDVKDYDINIYDKERKVYKTIKCDNEAPSSYLSFAGKDVVAYSCGWSSEDKYYNIKTGKDVLVSDFTKIERKEVDGTDNYVVDNLYEIIVNGEKGLYNDNNELLLKLDKDDKVRYIQDNIYKVTKSNGTVEYYELKGNSWNY